MEFLRKTVTNEITGYIKKLDPIKSYFNIYPDNNCFIYENNTIYEDIYSIDVNSFNLQFLKYINRFIKSNNIKSYIEKLNLTDKHKRVVEFGLLYKGLSFNNIHLSEYMISTRNIIFIHFFDKLKLSPRGLRLLRLNYDDIEFSTLESDITSDLYVHKHFLDIVKTNKYDKVIVLNKKDGVYYIKEDKIVDIKYTSGWVEIPAYIILIQLVVSFILNRDMTMKELNDKIIDYIDNSDNHDFFGFDEDISRDYSPDDIVPVSAKYLFVANVMSKFSILFK